MPPILVPNLLPSSRFDEELAEISRHILRGYGEQMAAGDVGAIRPLPQLFICGLPTCCLQHLLQLTKMFDDQIGLGSGRAGVEVRLFRFTG